MRLFLLFSFLFSTCILHATDSTRTGRKKEQMQSTLLKFHYARHMPAGDMADRFGSSNAVGAGVVHQLGNNWQLAFSFRSIFSGKVKENGVLDSITGDNGLLLDINGTYAEVRMYERGYCWHVDFGKVFPIGNFSDNTGLLLSGGIGFIQHKIKFTFQRTVLPQLESDYFKGYDRLSNGLMFRGFAGYQHIDRKGLFNFVAGLEYMHGTTRSRRSYNYDTRMQDGRLRSDILLGVKVGVMIMLGSRQAGVNRKERERYFE